MHAKTISIPALALFTLATLSTLTACGGDPAPPETGPNPTLPEPSRGLLPSMDISTPTEWGDEKPTVPDGYQIEAIAKDMKIPRQTLLLPNGDILVAEGSGGGNAPAMRPEDVIAGFIKKQGTTSVKPGNRLTLLRDDNGDGRYETREVFADNLNAPYGLALIDDTLYVANQDALVRFDYEEGQTRASGPPETVTDLPAKINHHWTKAMTAGPDGEFLYVGIGSNSNIGERGMDVEEDRAMVWQIDAESGRHKPYATGLRNPTAFAIHPDTDQLWTVVNERDELGANLVPDYLTSVQEGAFYGWPYSYWGDNVDTRVKPPKPEKVESAIKPDYALGSHVAALGVDFSEAGESGKRHQTGLRARLPRGRAGRGLLRWKHGRAVRRGRLCRPARQLEPQRAGGLQSGVRAVQQRRTRRRAHRLRHRLPRRRRQRPRPARGRHRGPGGRADHRR